MSIVSVQKFDVESPQPRVKLVSLNVTGTSGVQQVSQIVCVADVASSLNSTYFEIDTPSNSYYVWIDVDSAGVDPAVSGKTGVQVAVVEDDTDDDVAIAVAAALDALSDMSASAATGTVTATNAAYGLVTDAVDGADATGFTITTPTAGVDNGVAAVFGKRDVSIAQTSAGHGDYTITFTEPFVQAPHVVALCTTARAARVVSVSKTAVRIATKNLSGTLTDSDFHLLIFGSQIADQFS